MESQPTQPQPELISKKAARQNRARNNARGRANRESTPPEHIGVLWSAVLMTIGGWWGLFTLITTQKPFVGQRWIFFVLLQVTATGMAMPFLRYLNLRLMREGYVLPGIVIVRQSVWFGLFVVTCAWLQMPRVLNVGIAVVLAVAFIVVEVFLRTREIAHERENAE